VDWIVITGVPPWDGRYPFDIAESEPTTREWGWIKRLSGYLPTTIEEGLRGADPELICAFAAIALRRAGKLQTDEVPALFDRLVDAPFGATVKLETDAAADEGDAGPPPENSNASSSSSGTGSPTSSERSEPTPAASGIPASDPSESPSIALVSTPRAS
jgi:hypothetical protein